MSVIRSLSFGSARTWPLRRQTILASTSHSVGTSLPIIPGGLVGSVWESGFDAVVPSGSFAGSRILGSECVEARRSANIVINLGQIVKVA